MLQLKIRPQLSLIQRDSPVSFPIPETAVSTDAVCTDFEMVKNNLNLKTNEIDSVKFKK